MVPIAEAIEACHVPGAVELQTDFVSIHAEVICKVGPATGLATQTPRFSLRNNGLAVLYC